MEATRQLAAERGLVVTGSEIVGMVPYPALLETGKFYLRRQDRSAGIPDRDILETAIQSLGLRDVTDFNLEERVLGLPTFQQKDLAAMKLHAFIDEVSRESPAPGGGSIAALAGALGAALASMVANLSIGKRGTAGIEDELKPVAERAQDIKDKLLKAIDADTRAFNAYMEARRLPSGTEEEKMTKQNALQAGLKEAISVPLATARMAADAIDLAGTALQKGNINSVTDAAVGAQIAYTGVKGGIYNVLINLKEIEDKTYIREMIKTCRKMDMSAQTKLKAVLENADKKISELMPV
jgi:glutamate formiminotransferase/formiminotetrahydrofolate cyclodeaminase